MCLIWQCLVSILLVLLFILTGIVLSEWPDISMCLELMSNSLLCQISVTTSCGRGQIQSKLTLMKLQVFFSHLRSIQALVYNLSFPVGTGPLINMFRLGPSSFFSRVEKSLFKISFFLGVTSEDLFWIISFFNLKCWLLIGNIFSKMHFTVFWEQQITPVSLQHNFSIPFKHEYNFLLGDFLLFCVSASWDWISPDDIGWCLWHGFSSENQVLQMCFWVGFQ